MNIIAGWEVETLQQYQLGLSSVTDRLRWSDAWPILRYAVLSLRYAFGGEGAGGRAKHSVLNMF